MNLLKRALLASGIALAALSTSANANLVTNGDFNTGDFSGWTLAGDLSYTSIRDHSAWLGPIFGAGILSQDFATSAGATYDVSFTLMSTGSASPGYFDVFFGNSLLFSTANTALPLETHTFDAVASGASTTLRFVYFNVPDYYVLGHVSVSPVPEPSEMALMLVGSGLLLVAIQRKRKTVRA
jgi:hypothetical protein